MKENYYGATREFIIESAKNQYGTTAEYLWKTDPDYAVLRGGNKKWYAVIMDVPKEKLGIGGKEKVDVMVVRCGFDLKSVFIGQKGFLPAYHMNKEHWISVLLDGSVDGKTALYLLDVSYLNTIKKQK